MLARLAGRPFGSAAFQEMNRSAARVLGPPIAFQGFRELSRCEVL